MNIQNLLSQMMSASNPLAMLTGMLNPNQKQQVSQFQNKTTQEQAEEIARVCNEKGISKEQFTQIVNMLNKR